MLPDIATASARAHARLLRRRTAAKAGVQGGKAVSPGGLVLPSERDAIVGWLEQRCRGIQERIAQSHGKFKAIARCELETVRAILREIENGDHAAYSAATLIDKPVA